VVAAWAAAGFIAHKGYVALAPTRRNGKERGLGRILANVLPLIRFIPDSRTYSVALYLKRQCERTPGKELWKLLVKRLETVLLVQHWSQSQMISYESGQLQQRRQRFELFTRDPEGTFRDRLHCRFVPPLIHSMPDSLTYSVRLFLKRQCDQTPGTFSNFWNIVQLVLLTYVAFSVPYFIAFDDGVETFSFHFAHSDSNLPHPGLMHRLADMYIFCTNSVSTQCKHPTGVHQATPTTRSAGGSSSSSTSTSVRAA
jgi:hypothetical protein